MPVSQSTRVDLLIESRSQPNDFDGVITRAPCAPGDWGKMWKEGWDESWTPPFFLGFYIHFQPDPGTPPKDDEFRTVVDSTNWGGLQYQIAATADVDPDGNVSDIEYPGSPASPHGLDMNLFHDAAAELWDASGADVTNYQQALLDTYGGVQPFNIGDPRRSGLNRHTNWEFFLDQLEKLTNWHEAVEERLEKGVIPHTLIPDPNNPSSMLKVARNPHELLTGFRGHFVKIPVPQRRKKSAMKEDGKKKAFELLVPVSFEKYVDVDVSVESGTTPSSTRTTTSTASPASGDDPAAKFSAALLARLKKEGGALGVDEIQEVALSFPKEDDETRRFAITHRRNQGGFLESIEGTDWDEASEMLLEA